MKAVCLCVVGMIIYTMLVTSPAIADDAINLNCGDVAGLINAINAANEKPLNTTSTINLNSNHELNCSYYLTNPHGQSGNGLPRVSSNLTINGNSAAIHAIQSESVGFRIFDVRPVDQVPSGIILDSNTHSPANLTLSNLVLTGGSAPKELLNPDCLVPPLFASSSMDNCGGAIFNTGTTTLVDTTLRYNYGTFGAGIYNAGSLSLVRTNVVAGVSSSLGGGIFNSGNMILTESTVDWNSAVERGGGIFNVGIMEATDSSVSGNYARLSAGGIYNSGELELNNASVSYNSVLTEVEYTDDGFYEWGEGGGIYTVEIARISGGTITGNSAAQGGGIVHSGQQLDLDSTTVSYNMATLYSGGLDLFGEGVVNVINSEITANGAMYGPAGGILAGGGGGSLYVTDSAIRGNYGQLGGGIYLTGSVVTLSDVIVETNTSDEGGGIYVGSGTLIANNASINGNSAYEVGGGVATWGNKVVTLVGGSVSRNWAGIEGGGIYNAMGSVVTAAGTEIIQNSPDNCSGIVVGC